MAVTFEVGNNVEESAEDEGDGDEGSGDSGHVEAADGQQQCYRGRGYPTGTDEAELEALSLRY